MSQDGPADNGDIVYKNNTVFVLEDGTLFKTLTQDKPTFVLHVHL